MPVGMNTLSLMLLVQSRDGSFAHAGWVSAAYLSALALQAPITGRFMDNNGPQKLMMPLAFGHSLALVLLVVAVFNGLSLPWLLASAFLAGTMFPPVSMTIRSMYRKSTMPDPQKQSAFATESVIMETAFIGGPLIVSLAVIAGSVSYAVIASSAMMLYGVWRFSHSGALARWGTVERGEHIVRHWLGPLKVLGVRRALLLAFLLAMGIGLLEISMPAFATFSGAPASVGYFYAAMSLPSAITGFAYGTRHFSWPMNRQITVTALWIGLTALLMALCSNAWLFALACAVTGAGFGPMLTALNLQLGKLTPVEYSSEAYTWSTTVFMIGLSVGFSVGGALIERTGWAGGLQASAAVMLVAAGWALCVPEVRSDVPA